VHTTRSASGRPRLAKLRSKESSRRRFDAGLLFYLFAGLTLLCALLVVANPFSRNPVTSVMFLVLTIASLAGIFILLDAYFLAAVQVLVYAGA